MKNINQNSFSCINCNTGKLIVKDKVYFECNNCKKNYSIVNNIPRFVGKNNYSNSFGYQWNIFDKTQLDSYTKKILVEVEFMKLLISIRALIFQIRIC